MLPEYEYSRKSSKKAYYVIGVDVGRKNCTTEAVIVKVTPQAQGSANKSVVNIYSFDEQHFEDQAIELKKLFYKYKARTMVVDANGMGIGLIDYLIKGQDCIDGTYLPPFGVENDPDGFYKQYRTDDMERDALYLMKANAPINTEMYAYVQTQLSSGKIKFLIDENRAKTKLLSTRIGNTYSIEKRAEHLKPFVMTSILQEEMKNLVEENEGMNIILKQSSRSIKKDKFSAFGYALYYVKKEEDKNKKRKKINMSDLMLFS